MGIRSGFWKLFGAEQGRESKRAQAAISASAQFDDWARELSDDEYADAAHGLRLFGDSSEDLARFLALARAGAERKTGLRPFDVQLQGAVRMFAGDVVEMATGEGKTLSGAIAAAGYALQGHSVHVISVNDYLARRDAEWMGEFLRLLGLSVAWVEETTLREDRRAAYKCDIVYGSVTEFGFDVLREQLATNPKDLIAPITDVAIIDEADSVLVDEALVPLVLAGSTAGDAPSNEVVAAVKKLRSGKHYKTDSDKRNIFLTEEGAQAIENELGIADLYDTEHVGTTLVQVNVALHAHELLIRDVHYIVRDHKIHLINASRGRVAELQRWPDGLQAAVEAKEGVPVSEAGEILDTITIQALIGRYTKVCGMTGTAVAAGKQLREFYDLGVSQIPANTACIREDEPDRVFRNKQYKLDAIVQYIAKIHETGQPILIGTHDVAESEHLAERLGRAGVECSVLNAKNDAEEATVIAEAGDLGRVTVSTQMAGRGTDIRLGGSDESHRDEVIAAGGLCVVGTGRHRTERLDNQLRGRSGRQGDPGRSVFFSAMDDEVVLSGTEEDKRPTRYDPDTGEMLGDKAQHLLDHAQRVTDGQMLEVHANTWRYSQLLADQRDILATRREKLLLTEAAFDELGETNPKYQAELVEEFGRDTVVQGCRDIMLWHLDRAWADHLADMSDVRESIHLRALGRENPLDEFHRIAIDGFRNLAATAVEKSALTFADIEFDADGPHLEDAAMGRPSSTWTYMVHDNPMSAGGNVFSSLMSSFR